MPSEQFGFSEQEVWGVGEKKAARPSTRPTSLQEVLQQQQSRPLAKPSPVLVEERPELQLQGESPGRSPSVLSLELEAGEAGEAGEADRSSPGRQLAALLAELVTLYTTVRDSLETCPAGAAAMLAAAPPGQLYRANLGRVRSVQLRVGRTCATLPGLPAHTTQLAQQAETAWIRLAELWPDSGGEEEEKVVEEQLGQCGVCLQSGASLSHGGAVYHLTCANFWVHCVRDSLPCLASETVASVKASL